MLNHAFHHRSRALENEFFRRVDHELVVKVQEQYPLEVDEDALAIACGICDRKLLDELLAAEITPKTLTALSLLPAVYVAWANGYVEAVERKAVLDAAHSVGVCEGTPAYELLECWLKLRPTDRLIEAWKEFIHASRPTLSVDAFRQLRDSAMTRARDIASAAGGFLGIGSVSAMEKAALMELEGVFTHAAKSEAPATT